MLNQRMGRRLVSVTHRVIFGVEQLILLKQISTSLLEGLNGTIRLHVLLGALAQESFDRMQPYFVFLLADWHGGDVMQLQPRVMPSPGSGKYPNDIAPCMSIKA